MSVTLLPSLLISKDFMHCFGVSSVNVEQVNTDRVGFKLCYQNSTQIVKK